MRFEWIARNIDACFHGRDPVIDDEPDRDSPQTHPNHLSNCNGCTGNPSTEPRHEVLRDNDREYENDDSDDCDHCEGNGFHNTENYRKRFRPKSLFATKVLNLKGARRKAELTASIGALGVKLPINVRLRRRPHNSRCNSSET
jgi:hypothetical protein